MEKKKTVEEQWLHLVKSVYPFTISKDRYFEMKKIFYAGFSCGFTSTIDVFTTYKTAKKLKEVLKVFDKELSEEDLKGRG